MSQKLRPCVRLKRRHLPERVLQATGVLQAAETHLPGVRRALLHRWVCARKYTVLTQWKRELTLSGWLTDWEWGFVRKVNYNGSFTDIELRVRLWGLPPFKASSEGIIQLPPHIKSRGVFIWTSPSFVFILFHHSWCNGFLKTAQRELRRETVEKQPHIQPHDIHTVLKHPTFKYIYTQRLI